MNEPLPTMARIVLTTSPIGLTVWGAAYRKRSRSPGVSFREVIYRFGLARRFSAAP
jgi:hypothetical protein